MRKIILFISIIIYALFIVLPLSKIYASSLSQNYSITVSGTITPTKVVFSGYTSPSSIVYLLEDGSVLETSLSDTSGNFSITLTNPTSGIHNYTLYSQDANGLNTSYFNVYDNVVLDRTNTIYNINLSPTISVINSNNLTNIEGYAYPQSSIEIFLNGVQKYLVSPNQNGFWSYPINNLQSGDYSVSALSITSSGVLSNQSNIINFSVISSPQGVNSNNINSKTSPKIKIVIRKIIKPTISPLSFPIIKNPVKKNNILPKSTIKSKKLTVPSKNLNIKKLIENMGKILIVLVSLYSLLFLLIFAI